MNEREISLVDLMVEILLHWRGIIILMVIGGVLLGAFSYTRSAQSIQQAAEMEKLDHEEIDTADALKKAEEGLTEVQVNNVNYALYYEKLCREKELYVEQSVLMQIDADNVHRADMTFMVSSDDLERSYNLEMVYEDFARSSELLELLGEKCQVPVAMIGEIYSMPRSSAGTMKGSDTFRVTIMHYDEKVCQELAQTIVDYIKQKHGALVREMGEHEITVLNQSVGTLSSADVLNSQNSTRNDILSLQSSAARVKDAFTEEEERYYNLLVTPGNEGKEDEDGDEAEDENIDAAGAETAAAPRVSMKYVLLGMIFAAFVYAFILFMIYVLNNKLRATDQLQELYNIPQLGQIPEGEKKKKVLDFVDKWILTLRYWNQRKFTPEEALNLTAVAVKMAAGKEALDTVCLMGCDLKAQAMEDCEKIKEILSREKVEARILDNVLYDAEAMEKLEEVKGVVLVEKAGSTLYTEIAQELELLKRQDIKVLGGVIVG